MQIAVQGDFLRQQDSQLENDFLYQVLLHLAANHPSRFQFLFPEQPQNHRLESAGSNFFLPPASWLPAKKLAKNWWFRMQVPAFLKKQQAAAFISEEQPASGTIPSWLLATRLHSVKLAAGQQIIAPSQWAAKEMAELYGISAASIHMLPAAPSPLFHPQDWQTKENVKMQYADGSEFFIFFGSTPSLSTTTHVLKAFSVFKKWQKSSMKLLVAGVSTASLPEIETYKYRNDLIILTDISPQELALLTAAAYAMVYPAEQDASGVAVLNAMASQVPVIASNSGALPEVGGEAVLYSDAGDFAAIGQHMIQLYKDEALCNKLAAAGGKQIQGKSWKETAEILWLLLQNAGS